MNTRPPTSNLSSQLIHLLFPVPGVLVEAPDDVIGKLTVAILLAALWAKDHDDMPIRSLSEYVQEASRQLDVALSQEEAEVLQ